MSMSEFEEQSEHRDSQFSSLPQCGRALPTDFSEEDLAFAQELDTLFSIEQEELPPYFVQTLLDSEDPRFTPVEHGFEHKTSARVFRRLKLRRRLFPERRPFWHSMLLGVAISRRLAAVCAALVAFMVVTMAVNAPSFASGLEILLQNGQAGVYQVSGPISNKNVTSTQVQNPSQDQQISLLGAQQRLHFPIYWPQDLPNGYTQSQIYLYTQNSQLQSDGPVLEFQFTHAGASGSHAQLAIREFKPKGDVLQVVEAGSARPLETDQNGRAKSIYIDGQWVTINYAHHWLHNGHCELMLQRDGVVFLIAGDQREHVGLDDLLSIANSLQPLQVNRLMRSDATMEYVTQVNHDMPGPFDGDIFLFSSDNGTGGPYLRLIGTDQPPEQ